MVYHSQVHKIHRQGQNPEGNKEKNVLSLQGKIDQVHSKSLHRDLAVQKGVDGNIQHAEWEKYAAQNSLSSQAVIQNRKTHRKFSRQTETKEFMTSKLALQETYGGLFQWRKKDQKQQRLERTREPTSITNSSGNTWH